MQKASRDLHLTSSTPSGIYPSAEKHTLALLSGSHQLKKQNKKKKSHLSTHLERHADLSPALITRLCREEEPDALDSRLTPEKGDGLARRRAGDRQGGQKRPGGQWDRLARWQGWQVGGRGGQWGKQGPGRQGRQWVRPGPGREGKRRANGAGRAGEAGAGQRAPGAGRASAAVPQLGGDHGKGRLRSPGSEGRLPARLQPLPRAEARPEKPEPRQPPPGGRRGAKRR